MTWAWCATTASIRTSERTYMSKFKLAPFADWKIDQAVRPPRRDNLLGTTSFVSIVARIGSEARVVRVRREPGEKTMRGHHRYEVTLAAERSTVDLWHNSRGGYRAQYYVSPNLGDAANAYAVDVLGALAGRLIDDDSRRRRYWPLASSSIYHPHTRIWIWQGLWLRRAKRTDRLLHASGWQLPTNSKERKLANWGALIPGNETRLVLKGQWLRDGDGAAIDDPPKTERASQICRFGFT
jgi:hypothetical protein